MMPKAIMALRSYPLALFIAALVFVCTLLLAANSIGKIGGGGDDEGSGLGGTGKSGDYGFGGTGGPRPVLGETERGEDNTDQQNWPAPWFPREPEPQDVMPIPADMQPLVELQRNPLGPPPGSPLQSQPATESDQDRLYILDDDTAGMPAPLRQLIEMANSDEDMIAPTVLELRLRVPDGPPDADNIEAFRMELAAEPAPADAEPATAAEQATPANPPNPLAEPAPEPSVPEASPHGMPRNSGLAELDALDGDDDKDTLDDNGTDRRVSPERLQRPELPPFQRMRPAIDRASMVPPRIQPLNI